MKRKLANWIQEPSLFSALSASFLFADVDEGMLRELLCAIPSPIPYEKGATIYSPHEFQRALGIVLAGSVAISLEEDGRHVLMNQLEASGIFGAAALYGSPEEYVTDIQTLEPCVVLFLTQEQMTAIMRQNFDVAENYIRFLSGRVRFLNQRIAGFTGGAADRRLALYLLEHHDGHNGVNLPSSMVSLAASLNVGRSSLYRSLDVLIAAGLISRDNGGITILDLHRLRAVVG